MSTYPEPPGPGQPVYIAVPMQQKPSGYHGSLRLLSMAGVRVLCPDHDTAVFMRARYRAIPITSSKSVTTPSAKKGRKRSPSSRSKARSWTAKT